MEAVADVVAAASAAAAACTAAAAAAAAAAPAKRRVPKHPSSAAGPGRHRTGQAPTVCDTPVNYVCLLLEDLRISCERAGGEEGKGRTCPKGHY